MSRFKMVFDYSDDPHYLRWRYIEAVKFILVEGEVTKARKLSEIKELTDCLDGRLKKLASP